jgi:hypothetical protein
MKLSRVMTANGSSVTTGSLLDAESFMCVSRGKDMAMKTTWMRGLSALGLLLAMTARTQANDIVDFLRAVNGVPEHRHAQAPIHQAGHSGYGRDHSAHYGDRGLTSRDVYKQFSDPSRSYGGYGRSGYGYGGSGRGNYGRDNVGRNPFDRGYSRSSYGHSGARISLRIGSDSGALPVYTEPLYIPAQEPQILPPVQAMPQVQSYPPVQVLPHQIGEIVDCHVRLATCVQVEDDCNIAPNAVPVVVAVRDPSLCEHECHDRLVYVQVFVPPCPMRSLTVSPCRTRIKMDFGHHQVDIKSTNNVIVVDYDN